MNGTFLDFRPMPAHIALTPPRGSASAIHHSLSRYRPDHLHADDRKLRVLAPLVRARLHRRAGHRLADHPSPDAGADALARQSRADEAAAAGRTADLDGLRRGPRWEARLRPLLQPRLLPFAPRRA